MIISLSEEDFNDRCEALLDTLYITYHRFHYTVGPIDLVSFTRRKEARNRRKEIRQKQLLAFKKGKR